MWKKLLVITFLFYIIALLQNSFLIHYNLFGVVPNLIFILFFIIVFFEKRNSTGQTVNDYLAIFTAVIAGVFLDIFSYTYLGPSIILLIIIGLLVKRTQSSLKNKEDKYPFIYFSFIFIISLFIYNFLITLFLSPNNIATMISLGTVFMLIYNLFIASILFYIYKKFNGKSL